MKLTLNGILLDLKDDAWGLIDQALIDQPVCIADLFLDEGQVVLEMRALEDPAKFESGCTR